MVAVLVALGLWIGGASSAIEAYADFWVSLITRELALSGALRRSTGHHPVRIQELVLAREWRFESSLEHH
jgi:hypothetical protein